MRTYKPLERYTFKAEDDWGDYSNGKYRKGYMNANGYCIHPYNCDDGKRHTLQEHKEKWIYFNGDIPDGMEIDHIIPIADGGTNKLSNLKIGTHRDNMNNPYTIEKLKNIQQTDEQIIKAAQGKWKKIYQYNKDLKLVSVWNCADECVLFGYCKKNIQRCCRGERKTHKGYIWSYEPL